MELDKSKPFGTIHGDISGRRFEQGGRYFDGDGKEIGGVKPDKAETPKAAPPKGPDVPTPRVPPIVNEQLAKQ